MCGFVGYVNAENDKETNQKIIKAMADRIIHRGPDQDDYYVDSEVSLGFRRLSIIDLDGGSQPITNEDGSRVIVFNGEIYNYQEIREELIEKGHIFKTKTDTEVIPALRNTEKIFSQGSEVCLRSLSGTKTRKSFSVQGIFLESSLFTMRR